MNTDNKQIVLDMYDAFGRGDVDSIVNRVTDDVRWISYYGPSVPWGGDHSGKQNVGGFFHSLYESVDVLAFDIHSHIGEGDMVVTTGNFACRSKSTGREGETKWVFVWKLTDGNVTSYEHYHERDLSDLFA